ncbi:hypothetical protein [Flavobacterium sp. M31R6]|uniref:hypothetical protein n=1 Tax=Flavobacterium sp. M31R6 TaxID=2739062 RepID=UPI001567F01F|nr:hypothetical protein [Flavobacterium sp. M31R6]QKJ63353.1 hypothetical protein HQN62_09480 [Flavobacterium sp. M31R6]
MVKIGTDILLRVDKINYDLSNVVSVYEEFKLSYLSINKDKNEFDFVKDELIIFRAFLEKYEITEEIQLEPSKISPDITPVIPYTTLPNISNLLKKKIYAYYKILELNGEELFEMESFYKNHFASVFYDRSKFFSFFKIICFEEEHYLDVQKAIDAKEKLYNYLLCQLDDKEDQIRFKGDFLDNLNELIAVQKHTKFKIYFEEFLNKIRKNELMIDYSNSIQNNDLIDVNLKSTISINLYPRIFTTDKAFAVFKKSLDEFGNTDENLANYSFVFHRMKEDNLIYDDYQQTQFVFFLLKFDINIDRVKTLNLIGYKSAKERTYKLCINSNNTVS